MVALALLLAASGATAEEPDLGFETEVSVSGFFSPVLKQVKVTTVAAGSPAAVAGLKPGDYIVEADGRLIDGAPAHAMAIQFESVQPGQHLHLKLKRANTFLDAEIVAGS